jgi:sodium/proline symporter
VADPAFRIELDAARREALAGIISGGTTVLVWKQFGWFGLYEIVPGFILSVMAIFIVSLFDKAPSEEILQEFNLSRSCEPS